MSFSTNAENIRRSLKKYTKNSIIHGEIKRLSKSTSDGFEETKKMPWLSFLLIECSGQVKLATVLYISQYLFSDSSGVSPPL
jgi:hypothetical protein